MIATVAQNGITHSIDLNAPIDISLPIQPQNGVSAWYVSPPEIKPVIGDGFIGDVAKGGSVNFKNISFNPHGHGTHTECFGHISPKGESVNQHITSFHFISLLISVLPQEENGDLVITKKQIEDQLQNHTPEALILRTLPNNKDKKSLNYSNTNPPYLKEDAAKHLAHKGIKHLLIDLPSVDREEDGGKLLAHKAFWNYPDSIRKDASITELIYVPDSVKDGHYLLNLQFASVENDASPSKPVLYELLPNN